MGWCFNEKTGKEIQFDFGEGFFDCHRIIMHKEDEVMLELRKFVAPEFIFGHGALNLVGQYAINFGAKKVLVVTDPGVIASGWTANVTESLEKAGLPFVIYSDVTPNPKSEEVMKGSEIYFSQQCDVIVAVGGGSPMDCAKGIGISSTNRKNVLEFEGIDNVDIPGPPLICVPTTAGTSADVSQFAIITNQKERVKIAIISKTVVPDVALIDPATTITMETYLTACTGMDALVHAIEAFVSTANSPIMDLHALEAIRLINTNLIDTIANPDDIELRGKMMLGSLEAGLAFSNASLGAVHAMAHSLGGYLDLPHGECNSILLFHVMAYNYEVSFERYERIGSVLGIDMDKMTSKEKRIAVLDYIEQLKTSAGILKTLGERGVHRSDIPELSKKAIQDSCMVTNPRRPNQRDIEVIYEEAL
jgi:alcohol dehydrogenase class IV